MTTYRPNPSRHAGAWPQRPARVLPGPPPPRPPKPTIELSPEARSKVAALRQSNPDDRALVPILWQALINAGAMRHGIFANLDSWMFRQKYGCRHPEDLTAAQAADAVRKLSFWLGRTYTEAQQAASSPA